MKGRADAIDILRCLAIAGMVLNSQICFTPGLPAWMHHAQIPPPAFAFDPTVYGITWVDLVFPFFLFTMGAAIPLSLRGRLEKGASLASISGGVIKRGLLLVFFAIIRGNTGYYTLTGQLGPVLGSVATVTTWILLGAMFVRLPRSGQGKVAAINVAGGILSVAMLLLLKYGAGVDVSINKSDPIIHILATAAVFGGLMWLFSRDSIKLRIYLTALLAAVKISLDTEGSWLGQALHTPSLGWLWSPYSLQYLCILLPGTIAGDMVWRWMKLSREGRTAGAYPREAVAGTLMAATVVVTLWAMFSRHVGAGATWAVASGVATILLLKSAPADHTRTLHYRLASIGFMLLVAGFVLEPFEGGIRKDFPTLGYHFTTAGLAAYSLAAISILATRTRIKTGFLCGVGRNPMIAYTAAGYLVLPLLTLTGLGALLGRLASAGPAGGLASGVIVTAAAMTITWGFTKAKIYWKT